MKYLLIVASVIAVAVASPTRAVVTPGGGAAPVVPEDPSVVNPAVVGPTFIEQPIAEAPIIIDTPVVDVSPAVVAPEVIAPDASAPVMVQIILNIQSTDQATVIDIPVIVPAPIEDFINPQPVNIVDEVVEVNPIGGVVIQPTPIGVNPIDDVVIMPAPVDVNPIDGVAIIPAPIEPQPVVLPAPELPSVVAPAVTLPDIIN